MAGQLPFHQKGEGKRNAYRYSRRRDREDEGNDDGIPVFRIAENGLEVQQSNPLVAAPKGCSSVKAQYSALAGRQ